MRERNVPHRHLQAPSITELEMFGRWPGLLTPTELTMLESEGLIRDGKLTPKGARLLEQLTAPPAKK